MQGEEAVLVKRCGMKEDSLFACMNTHTATVTIYTSYNTTVNMYLLYMNYKLVYKVIVLK